MIPGIIASRGPLSWNPGLMSVPPSIWLDDSTSVTNVSGYASAWASKGTASGGYGQAESGRRPQIMSAGLNGLRTLKHDGVDDYLGSGDAALLNAFRARSSGWIFAVVRKLAVDAGGENRNIVSNAPGNAAGGGRLTLGIVGNKPYLYSERPDGAAGALLTSTLDMGTDWRILYVQANWGAATAAIDVDGSADVSSTSFGTPGNSSDTVAYYPAGIGAFVGSPPVVFADVECAAILQSGNGLPSSDERDKLAGWAAWRYGLEGNLPVGHPYKSAPP